MKIYNKNLKLQFLDKTKLKDYLYNSRNISYIYSKKGVYRIYDNKDLHEINIIDGKIDNLENYVDGENYLIDYTIIKKNKKFVSNLPLNHIKKDLLVNYYSLRDKSPIIFVIEEIDNNIYDVYFMLRDTYAAYSDADIHNPFILEDIKKFNNLIKL